MKWADGREGNLVSTERTAVSVLALAVALVALSRVAWAVTKQCTQIESTGAGGCEGTNESDVLLGNNVSSEEFFVGKAGDDTIRGFGGLDDVRGGDGNDALYGGDGHDELWGGNGTDELRAGDSPSANFQPDEYLFDDGWGKDRIFDTKPLGGQAPNNLITMYQLKDNIVVNMTSSATRSEVRTVDGSDTINWDGNVFQEFRAFYLFSGDPEWTITGNSSSNDIRANGAASDIRALEGDDTVSVFDSDGNGGDNADDADDRVDCGPGNDTVSANPGDVLIDCENQRIG